MNLMASEQKVAVVTGATGALGRVVAKTLIDNGFMVVSTFRTQTAEQELEAFLGGPGKGLMSIEADVSNEASVQRLFDEVIARFGRVDALLNIVGAYSGGSEVKDTKESDWDFMLKVNLKSTFLCCKHVLPHMIKRNYGKIVSVSARPAVEKRFRAKSGAYAVSKAGVAVLTETIAEEVRKYDINVNAIMPSTIDTPDNRASMPQADFSKWVKPEDIAQVILFLVSDSSSVTSGAVVPVYGRA